MNMYSGQTENLIGDFFRLNFTENEGMAFGMTLGGDGGKIALSLFRIGAVIGIAIYLRYLIKKQVPKGLLTAIAFIFAGALGNILDSAFYGLMFGESPYMGPVAEFMPEEGGYAPFLFGHVVDMLQVKYFPAVFNIADVSITVGVVMIILFQKRYFAKPEEEENGEESAATPQDAVVGEEHVTPSAEESTAPPSAQEQASDVTPTQTPSEGPAEEEQSEEKES